MDYVKEIERVKEAIEKTTSIYCKRDLTKYLLKLQKKVRQQKAV